MFLRNKLTNNEKSVKMLNKELEMAKKSEVVQEEVKTQSFEELKYTHQAIATRFDEETKSYEFVIVGYDPTSKQGEVTKVEKFGGLKQDAYNAFKRAAVDMGFV